MPKKQIQTYWVLNLECNQSLKTTLGEAASLDFGVPVERSIEIFDSFNQSLRKAELCLSRENGVFRLSSQNALSTGPYIATEKSDTNRLFWQDLETGELKETLQKYLKLRAATLLCSIKITTRDIAARNDDGKIIARLTEERIASQESEAHLRLLSLHPLRGYEPQAKRFAKILNSTDGLEIEVPCLAEWAINSASQSTLSQSTQKALQLNAEQTVQEAVSAIASSMIDSARLTEAGTCADIDTEFLHDYRVSIRRLRSILSLVKGAYDKSDTRQLKTEFGNIARKTNRLRDLDVYLMEADNFRSMLPEYLQPGLEPMFADFKAERVKELKTVQRFLVSKKYNSDMNRLKKWFAQESPSEGERSEEPIGDVAAAEIRSHYKKIAKSGTEINDSTPDDEVHELRIECKKLRYLLELFSSLFPEKEIKAITRQLKGLQNTLGDFNDYCVQQLSLANYLDNATHLDQKTASAIGGLISHLHTCQLEARSHVSEKFIQFNDEKMKQRFQRVFSKKRKINA